MNLPAFMLVRPSVTRHVYLLECKFCGLAGWHAWYSNGSCLHGDGKVYGAGAIIARLMDKMDITDPPAPLSSPEGVKTGTGHGSERAEID